MQRQALSGCPHREHRPACPGWPLCCSRETGIPPLASLILPRQVWGTFHADRLQSVVMMPGLANPPTPGRGRPGGWASEEGGAAPMAPVPWRVLMGHTGSTAPAHGAQAAGDCEQVAPGARAKPERTC